MIRVIGVLVVVLSLYGLLMMSDTQARSLENHINLERRIGEWGVLTLGAGFVIITSGIDLSIGSVVCLSAVSFGLFLENGFNPWVAVFAVLIGSAIIGYIHGLLITKVNLQPFIVTLCGLFIYRGLAQLLTLIKFQDLGEKLKQGWDGHGKAVARFLQRCWHRQQARLGFPSFSSTGQLAFGRLAESSRGNSWLA